MKIARSFYLFVIFLALLFFALVFSMRSPFKDFTYPIIYHNVAKNIDPRIGELENTHIAHMKDGTQMKINLVRATDDAYYVRYDFGRSGHMEQLLNKSKIDNLEEIVTEKIPISANEIMAKKLFPEFYVYRRDFYTFLSDESYFYIEDTIELLENLRSQIKNEFPEIITKKLKNPRSCVVIFREEEDYKKFASGLDSSLEESSGFYHSDYQTFFTYNMLSGKKGGGGKRSVSSSISASRDTIRHEAVHQIFYSYGLHVGINYIDRLWLVEGLAIYCEPYKVGKLIKKRRGNLRESIKSEEFIPLKQLVNQRGGLGIFKLEKMRLFYDESWALVYFLMNNYREGFGRFLKNTKEHPFICLLKGDTKLFEESLGVDIETLEKEFRNFCRK